MQMMDCNKITKIQIWIILFKRKAKTMIKKIMLKNYSTSLLLSFFLFWLGKKKENLLKHTYITADIQYAEL